MNIGVDMDSVIAEIIRPLDTFHNKKYKTNFTYEDHITYDLRLVWKCSNEEVFRRIFDYYESEEFLTTTPVEGSQKALKELSKKHSLHLITSRPLSLEKISHVWLNTFFPHIFTSIHHTNQMSPDGRERGAKKSTICKKIHADCMIDDYLTYALDCANSGIKTFLFPAPWNKNIRICHPRLQKATSWNEICYTISHESKKPHYKNRARV